MYKKEISIIFGISAATTILYEIIWARYFQLIFGSTVYTASTVFASILLGFSLGSLLFKNKSEKNQLAKIGTIQITIGIYALFIMLLFKNIESIYPLIPSSQIMKIIISLIILLPITILLGALWPLVHSYVISDITKIGKETGKIYSLNSLGSGIGAIIGGFILIPLIGFSNTSILTSSINIIIGLGVIMANKKLKKL